MTSHCPARLVTVAAAAVAHWQSPRQAWGPGRWQSPSPGDQLRLTSRDQEAAVNRPRRMNTGSPPRRGAARGGPGPASQRQHGPPAGHTAASHTVTMCTVTVEPPATESGSHGDCQWPSLRLPAGRARGRQSRVRSPLVCTGETETRGVPVWPQYYGTTVTVGTAAAGGPGCQLRDGPVRAAGPGPAGPRAAGH